MSVATRTYTIRSRYLVAGQGWKEDDVVVEKRSLEAAWIKASSAACELDKLYGDEHFWTVDLLGENGGSFVQLFHGRLA